MPPLLPLIYWHYGWYATLSMLWVIFLFIGCPYAAFDTILHAFALIITMLLRRFHCYWCFAAIDAAMRYSLMILSLLHICHDTAAAACCWHIRDTLFAGAITSCHDIDIFADDYVIYYFYAATLFYADATLFDTLRLAFWCRHYWALPPFTPPLLDFLSLRHYAAIDTHCHIVTPRYYYYYYFAISCCWYWWR